MDRKAISKLVQQRQTEDSLRQEFEQTLPQRLTRWLQVKPHDLIPATHFAAASSECGKLFRDGHFYGCIALTQAVAEALVRFMCQRNSWRPGKQFEKNVETLSKRKVIKGELKKSLLKIWEQRNDYHHLNQSVERDRGELEKLAKRKCDLLLQAEQQVFAFTVCSGKIVPKCPKYWPKGETPRPHLAHRVRRLPLGARPTHGR